MIKPSPHNGVKPSIHPTAFIAEDVDIIGDVTIGAHANIWYGAVLRGDLCEITVGEYTSIQDNTVVHSEPGTTCKIGSYIIIGHAAMVHGPCEIGDYSMVGLHSTIVQKSRLGKGAVLAAGSVLTGDAEEFGLYAGVPAIKKKDYGDSRIKLGEDAAIKYSFNGKKFKEAGYNQQIPKEYLISE